jgi:hypothetical protein
MVNPISAFNSSIYATSAWQTRLDAARAAEQAGAAAVQEAVAKQYGLSQAQVPQTMPEDGVGERSRQLQSNGLFAGTDLAGIAGDQSSFRLEQLANRPAQTLADLRNPQLSLDSAAFVNLFASARPTLNLAVNNQSAVEAQSRPFQHASATLARIYGGGEELAVDFAA